MFNQNVTAGAAAVVTTAYVAPMLAGVIPGGPIGLGVAGVAAIWGGSKLDGHAGAAVQGAGAGLVVGAILAYVNAGNGA